MTFSSPATSTAAVEDLDMMRARLLYQSKKRGILENDILIGAFAERNLSKMNQEQLESYDKLINGEHMEWDLFYFMSGKKEPPADVANSSAFKLIKAFVDERQFAKK
ncbi:TPR repeat region [Ancylostoma ceylanicum]|uniref:Succinate dehydrogenase assembly factor 2, mitochondrial n=1 Tax=Ancylostoma ceylanicum TaxID=53326 RepID=A0A0D6M4Z9_9BILA|nr:TPR repeat region [Ancylostoma ceylanicum]